jgi:sigma-B regulation protein RsbU (phosphoserine phosphatase)
VEISEKGSLTWTVTPDLLGILNRSGRFTDTNPAWFKTLGLTPSDIETKIFFDFIHPDDLAATEQAFKDIQAGMNILGFENRYCHADGDYRWLSWNCVPVNDLFFCSARDITAQKSTEEALRTSADVAALREQFVAVLGHDLRNPLAAISSGMNILRRKYDHEDTRDLIKSMDTSVRRMAGLIDDVMDFARARLGGGISVHDVKEVILTATLKQSKSFAQPIPTEKSLRSLSSPSR